MDHATRAEMGIASACDLVDQFHKHLNISPTQRLADATDPEVKSALVGAASLVHTVANQLLMYSSRDDRRALRAHLQLEEVAEFIEAMAHGDEQRTLDAMADQQYVLCGSAVTMDLPLAAAFVEVHRSNMTKQVQPNDPHRARVRDKGPNYAPPDIARVLADYRAK